MSSSPPSTCLLDLPNEILLIIPEDLDENSLVHLAETCHRLNFLLLPGIFAHFDLELSKPFSGVLPALSVTRKTFKILSAIGVGTFFKSIGDLDWSLTRTWRRSQDGDVRLGLSDAVLAASYLNSLAIRLPQLAHLRLNPYILVNSTEELLDWLQSLAVVLNSATRRADCIITVYGSPAQPYPADPRPFLHCIPNIPNPVARTAAPASRAAMPSFSTLAIL